MFRKRPFVRWLNHLSPVYILIMFYALSVVISTLLLSLPIAHKENLQIDFIDILFTAVSALSVTGLSPVTIVDTFSPTGIIFLAIILQLGAVGVMAIGTFFWLILGKRIGLKERQLIMTDQNQTNFSGMVRLIKQIIYVLLIVELIGFLVLGSYLLLYYPTAKQAYFHGFFATISAISNGGFDITGQSLIPYKNDYFIQSIHMFLIVFGAIGFPVLIEVKEYLFLSSEKKKRFRFSLFTKLTTATFFLLIVVGAIFIYLFDRNHYFAGGKIVENTFYALFQSVTLRSGGLSTLDVSLLTEQNSLFMSLLMFIGASPSSTGGGIRTTTFALVIIFMITYIRGGRSIRIFKREVYEEDLFKAVTVMLVAFSIVFTSMLFMSMLEPFSMREILFEITSAFGTVGLSLGITSKLTVGSKVLLMLLMFIGRVGILSFLFLFKKRKQNNRYHYPKERMIIG